MNMIHIRGACLHNLKEITLDLPKEQLVVLTGVSGSGKSTLAFDLLFEEGKKRYLQAIGTQLPLNEREAYTSITGLVPTVAVEQRVIRQSNPRSAVGTRTGVLKHLQVLYALMGQQPCMACRTPVQANTTCEVCQTLAAPLPLGVFSSNSAQGMCPTCYGRGVSLLFQEEFITARQEKTLAALVTDLVTFRELRQTLHHFCDAYEVMPEIRLADLPADARQAFLYGMAEPQAFMGLLTFLQTRIGSNVAPGASLRAILGLGYAQVRTCPTCQGFRVGQEALSVTLLQRHIGHLGLMTLTELHTFLANLTAFHGSVLGEALVKRILKRLERLMDVGLAHLSLYRSIPTLSNGEIQRLFLAAHLESELEGLLYIFDEPTAGLHEIEKESLLRMVRQLIDAGNSVIVVEHDAQILQAADHILEFGPGAGKEGGKVIYQGTHQGMCHSNSSVVGRYLLQPTNLLTTFAGQRRPVDAQTPRLILRHATTHNLQDITVSFPLGVLVGVAGVSGSGKSSLVAHTLMPRLKHCLAKTGDGQLTIGEGILVEDDSSENFDELPPILTTGTAELLKGWQQVTRCLLVSQQPIGRNKSSTPASYLGIWDRIRRLFAQEPEAKRRGYTVGTFSFNGAGACPTCSGKGEERFYLGSGQYVGQRCSTCQGTRYRPEVLEIERNGLSIHAVLQLSFSEARHFFGQDAKLHSILMAVEEVGLGYLTLGQPTPTLSGGEAQRIKLAQALGTVQRANILYVLDEPTTGLSYADIERLLGILQKLVSQGNSVIVVEHDPLLLSVCDWLIELGPGGGCDGGQAIAEGTPDMLKRHPASHIGPYLSTVEAAST